ncbi:MAG: heat-shock protein Hsp20 [Herpetosiphonaceae bacterium]|nr:MAG: heat-shock protein Hsp20 [Herpetosiphonaceae bacterium]
MTELARWNPTTEILSLRDAMDRLFEESFVRPWSLFWNGNGKFRPAMDVYETGDSYIVELTVPGLKPEQFDLTVTQTTLTVKGNVTQEERREQATYHLRERHYGNFVRTVEFPTTVNPDKVQAMLEHGILRIEVPKAEEAKPKKITIKAA